MLRPGGRLYASTNGALHMRHLHDLAQQLGVKPMWDRGGDGGFMLETGAAELRPYFPVVELRRYDSDLDRQ